MKTKIEQQIDDALTSLDMVKRAEISPYFKTRMKGILTQIQPEQAFLSFKFTIAIATIAIILTANTFLLYLRMNQSKTSKKSVHEISEISEMYHFNSTPVLDYDNQ
jgi:hypothetical protein